MAAPRRVNELTARKELIVAESDLHRQVVRLERARWQQRGAAAREFAGRHRWWLLGGAVIGGAVLARRWRALAGLLPVALAAMRALRR